MLPADLGLSGGRVAKAQGKPRRSRATGRCGQGDADACKRQWSASSRNENDTTRAGSKGADADVAEFDPGSVAEKSDVARAPLQTRMLFQDLRIFHLI